jgi:uncharacterized membrane protein YcaP (DUF421 family)
MDDVTFFFDGWAPLLRIVLIGTFGYATLIVLLRITRQRTLSRMTPFDFVITVTLGSAFGRVITAKDVALAEVVTAFVVLMGLQWAIVELRGRWPAFGRAISASPSLVYHDGGFVAESMRRHRLTQEDLLTAAREKGLGSIEEAYAIVLEPDGMFAVISPQQLGDGSALESVSRS